MNRIFASCLPLLLAACAGTPSVPDNLKPAAGEGLIVSVAARGVQIYECRPGKENPAASEWAFVAPEAELLDAQGRLIGKHYAGPHWESNDGSKVVGTVKSRADAPQAGAIPWLLLAARSDGPEGAFAKVSSVQRIHTVGGVAPKEGCEATTQGSKVRVAYTADYLLYGTK